LPDRGREPRRGRDRPQPRHLDRPQAGGALNETVLSVEQLRLELVSGEPVVEDVSFELAAGEALGLVGESGSGKTTTALALLGYCRPGVRVAAGTIEVAGERVTGRSETDLRRLRGRVISYVPQDPASALNPSVRVGEQVAGVLERHIPSSDVDRVVAE